MTFIVTFLALLLERFFDWSHLRHWTWYLNLEKKLENRFPSPFAPLALMIFVLLIIFILNILFFDVLFGLITLLFQFFILIYCLGPKNFWAESHASVNDVFIKSNRNVFAPVVWFILLGPIGPVLYRLTVLIEADQKSKFARQYTLLLNVLDWLPIRLLTLLFALGGHFVKVLSCWRKIKMLELRANETILVDCGHAALDNGDVKDALSLIDRSLIILIIILALTMLWF